MLVALRLANFVLIEKLELQLEPGFNVLTGETGAGKSIVVGALELVLGHRAHAEVVRPGARQAEIEALFDLGNSTALRQRLAAGGIECGSELVVRRVVQPNGRSRAYLNGRLCTVGELRALGGELADITSQHDGVALTEARRHIDYLDRYGKLTETRTRLSEVVTALYQTAQQMAAITQAGRERGERESFLRYQLEAIGAVGARCGEIDELQSEQQRLRHAEQLASLTQGAAQALEIGERSLCDKLGRVAAEVTAAAELDPQLAEAATEIDGCWARLRELAAELDDYGGRLEANPDRLEQVQGRMYEIEELQRRFGPTLDDVLTHEQQLQAELAELGTVDDRLPQLQARHTQLLDTATRLARQLSKGRRQAARRLSTAITAELAQLGMGEARVVVEVRDAPAPTATAGSGSPITPPTVDGASLGLSGIDRVQFLIAPGRGVPPRPLSRIASGGELSRALLALKVALGRAEQADHRARPEGGRGARSAGVQVFDEVDAGVGGATADKIGRAIARIAARRQVLCITHLGAIAAHADAQFAVRRQRRAGLGCSDIARVSGAARVAEIARMLTGDEASGSSTNAARELLVSAHQASGGQARA